jgi:hypothetical protein
VVLLVLIISLLFNPIHRMGLRLHLSLQSITTRLRQRNRHAVIESPPPSPEPIRRRRSADHIDISNIQPTRLRPRANSINYKL